MKTKHILYVFLLIAISVRANAQDKNDFERGLNGWLTKGKVSISKSNVYKGNNCVKIGIGHAVLKKQIAVGPFAVVLFNAQVKCSDTLTKAYSFIRFYNSKQKLLLEYKSQGIASITYQQTGNYTESPPETSYMEIGIENEVNSKGYVYIDDFEIDKNVGTPKIKHQSIVNIDQYMRPFWKADTIYNETVLLYSKDGKAAEGKLLFAPDKILSVKKFDLKASYQQNVDYAVSGNTITRLQNSAMPFRADTSFDTKNNLAWFDLQSQWVVVTYTHGDKWQGPVPVFKGDLIPGVITKLKAGVPVKIVALGMSITRGMNVSSYDNVSPYMPPYVDLFAARLKKAYNNNHIKLYNAGLPGAVVDWGAQYADKYINPLNPDLVIIDFGMNDFWRYTPEQFNDYIQTIIKKVRTGNKKAEFLLISNMKFDPDYILDSDKTKEWYLNNMVGYSKVLKQMETRGIVNLDMTSLSDTIYKAKKAKDCISNPLHPNDYMARWYAQGMAQLLISDFK